MLKDLKGRRGKETGVQSGRAASVGDQGRMMDSGPVQGSVRAG